MNLFDIVEREKWQKLQAGFSNALGIPIRTLDADGRPLPGINKPPQFCLDIIDKKGRCQDERCDCKLINRIEKDKSDNHLICFFGLHLYGIPIEIKGKGTVAYLIIGPVLLGKGKDTCEYEKIAKRCNISLDYLMDRLSGFKRFSFVNIESTVELLHEVTQYIAQLNYDTKRLRERFTVSRPLDSLIEELYSSVYTEEILSTLLDTSLNTTKGDTGSVMLLDQDGDELSVKFSRGLNDEAKNAKVKLGHGISGFVAKHKKPLLLDSSVKDSRIGNLLKRPDIKSSIVYPIEVRDRVLGVLNVNNIDPKRKFDSETIDLVSNLTRLVNVALNMFQKKS